MDSSERAAAWEEVLDGRPNLEELRPFSHNLNFAADRPGQVHGPLDQGASGQFQEGLVTAHARTVSARQNESCDAAHRLIIHATVYPQAK
jgi:hypothetical protein